MQQITPRSINRYVWIAGGGYVAVHIALAVVIVLAPGGNAFANAFALLGVFFLNPILPLVLGYAAGMLAAWRFAKEEQRYPGEVETRQFAQRTSMALTWIWMLESVVGMLVMKVPDVAFALATLAALVILGILAIITYWILRWSFGWYAKLRLEQQQAAR
ncbi:ABZJ_00895 family protein [Chitinolyticbacter albus]|uniref:ABZJ_00895 family protein n=1 Tax=Chitinolyticbacter albus TaxID=2961951 RepID=UPI00210D755D|nr:ABZJ_00895 family protein [Chitinolyticbacter albus]